jgi:hypothetical protein
MQAPLIAIAEAIDTARILANQNEETAPQSYVYGQLAKSLQDTLFLAIGDRNRAESAYQFILDGATVDQAVRSA